jgi:hypothetical protein
MEIDMTKQIPVRTVKLRTIMRSAAFVRGFKEARKGLPMDYDAYGKASETTERWNYERGRQFGVVYAGAIKDGRSITLDAFLSYNRAIHLNWVR